jgi:N-acyl-D-aspartate/D-glutamate deacylase
MRDLMIRSQTPVDGSGRPHRTRSIPVNERQISEVALVSGAASPRMEPVPPSGSPSTPRATARRLAIYD